MDKLTRVGRVIKAHGIVGELKVKFVYPFLQSDKLPNHLFINSGNNNLPYFIEKISLLSHPDYIVKFEDVSSRSAAESLKSREILMEEDELDQYFKLESDDPNYNGFDLYDEKDRFIGQISEVLPLPAQPTLSIIKDKKEILIPFVDDLIISIDTSSRKIKYMVPKGLLDLYS